MYPFFSKFQKCYQFLFSPWKEVERNGKQKFGSLVLRTLFVIVLFMAMDRTLLRLSNLPLNSYFEPIVYFEFVKTLFTLTYIPLWLLVIILLVITRRRLWIRWSVLPHGKSLRLLVLVSAAILAWTFTTYDYNLFFDQGHYLDRLILFSSFILVCLRPVFIVPFLTVLLTLVGQFNVIPGFSEASFQLPTQILILFSTFFLLFLLARRFAVSDFVFLTGCLVVSHYWAPGFAKMNTNWILYDELRFLLSATYANGWLGFLSSKTISSIVNVLAIANLPLKLGTLILEFGSILFFFRRRTARLFLGGWVLFHLGIFFVSGIFFWMWILVDLTFLYLLTTKDGFNTLPIFNRQHLALSLVVIIGGSIWSRPVILAWFDVPVTYTYRFEGETVDGNVHSLPPIFFGPYDYQFTLGAFKFLSDQPLMPIVWGASTFESGPHLAKLDSKQEFFKFEKEHGKIYQNTQARQKLEEFVKRYVQNWNRRRSNKTFLNLLQAPRQLWTFPISTTLKESDRIKNVTINQVTSIYANETYKEIRKVTVHNLEIPAK